MKRYSDREMGTELSRPGRRTLWGFVLFAMVWAGTAQASPIRHHHISSQGAPEFRAWDRFLAGGQSLWSHVQPPKITDQIHVLMNRALRSSDPLADPNVQYLLWRQSLNPARFNFWHPRIGRILQTLPPPVSSTINPNPSPVPSSEQNSPQTPSIPTTPAPTPSTTPTTPTGPTSPPQVVSPPPSATSPSPEPIPEPETLTIALVLIGAGLCWRCRNGRSPTQSRDE